MRARIVNFLNLVTRNSGPEAVEWTDQQIWLFIILWLAGLVAAGVTLYGVYEIIFRENDEGHRYMIAGIGGSFILGILGMIIGKFLRRN